MDLRPIRLSAEDIERVKPFIQARKVYYQPFIFSDDLEVGEGLAFSRRLYSHDYKPAVHWPDGPEELASILVRGDQLADFRAANGMLRRIYDHMVDFLCTGLGEAKGRTFAEFGCNTGYFLHALAQRGAAGCTGYDFTDNRDVFAWFNEVLGTNSAFLQAEWDSLTHLPRYADMAEADVVMSIAVTCHLADPVHHLTYLASRAREALFLWVPYNGRDDLSISFGTPGVFPGQLAWPLSFDNEVRPSLPLIEQCLRSCGFERLVRMPPPAELGDWSGWFESQVGILAFRTDRPATAYTGGRVRRPPQPGIPDAAHPPDPAGPPHLVFRGATHNIVHYRGRYLGVPIALGQVEVDKMDDPTAQGLVVADRLEALIERLGPG